MTPFSKPWYAEQCEEIRIYPERERGQNFLIDTNVVNRITENLELKKGDHVIEIGPGFGILTRALAQTGATIEVFDIEKKFEHTPIIEEVISEHDVTWNTENILNIDEREFPEDYILASNLPYSISSDAIIKFLNSSNPPKTTVFMLQKEVVSRITAQPKKMTQLGVMVQLLAKPKRLFKVSHEQFWPIPKVDSAVVRMDRKEKTEYTETALKLARTGFTFKRKKLSNNLAALTDNPKELLEKAGIDINVRSEELTIEDWLKLAEAFDN